MDLNSNALYLRQSGHPRLAQLGIVLLLIGFVALLLALLILAGGGLLADYFDARQITWRVAEPYECYPALFGMGSALFGFILHGLTPH